MGRNLKNWKISELKKKNLQLISNYCTYSIKKSITDFIIKQLKLQILVNTYIVFALVFGKFTAILYYFESILFCMSQILISQ